MEPSPSPQGCSSAKWHRAGHHARRKSHSRRKRTKVPEDLLITHTWQEGKRDDFSKDSTVLKHRQDSAKILKPMRLDTGSSSAMPAEPSAYKLPCGIPGLSFALLHEYKPIKCHSPGAFCTHHGPHWEKSSMTSFPPPISAYPPFKVPSSLRASSRYLLTHRGFQVALQSFKNFCLVLSQKLTAFTKAEVKHRPDFGFSIWEERKARGPVSTFQSCGAYLARSYTWGLQESSPKRSHVKPGSLGDPIHP